jgi:hypothetical protein
MKIRPAYLALILAAGSLGAISTITAAPAESNETAGAAEKETKKNTSVVVVAASPEKAHTAALEALAAIGCTVKKDTLTQIEGKRANKVGLAVGSGGEKLFVSIKSLSENKTEVTVVSIKTMLGIVGQKLWNEEVANHVRDALK